MLDVVACQVWRTPALAARLLDSVTRHPTLHTLGIVDDASNVPAAAGAALAGIVAANAPTLTALDVSGCSMGDAGLAPLLEALASNSHLRGLDIRENEMSAAFARDHMLPAVRANTSLRELKTGLEENAAVKEALAILAQR